MFGLFNKPFNKLSYEEKLAEIADSGEVLAKINGEETVLDIKSIDPGGKLNVKGEIPPNWGDEQRFTITVDDVIEANIPESYFESIDDKFVSFIDRFKESDPALTEAIIKGYKEIFKK
jgi:hypothetical protein